ncbi:helix-turn-helix domain-containing protein [Candidatus Thiothrix anitrata]|uniref:Helix-turn-helix transcriptional regulator n=1 Tax=Candidatus Thiothrix anitrata TaxID=2823902 RepID=A0ABX7X0G9_9GAMM|nr:helix-turn-helix transcriptional regulator [Candidatus Thiothrix anitrata]QTR49449.1 helix-turn-helix transcriptional regulator [Candidatus Thiothrix anitrata]
MSALDLAHHLREQLAVLGMTVTEASARSGISRQTWHRLLQADIDEARLSTLVKVANVLETHVITLLTIYFQRKPIEQYATQQGYLHLH